MSGFPKTSNCLAVVFLMTVLQTSYVLAQENVTKIAFVVGVSRYQKADFPDLEFAHKDAEDFSKEVQRHGFALTTVIGQQATKENVVNKLKEFLDTTKSLSKNDIVLISLAGHGVQKDVVVGSGKNAVSIETPLFCLYDSQKSDAATMISINWMLKELETMSGSSNNLIIIDACRNNPYRGARSLDGSTVKELPNKISILFGSSSGKPSYESSAVQQGIFTHVLLGGLRGDAQNSRGEVDWLRLAAHVTAEVPREAKRILDDPSIDQRPNLIGNLEGTPIIAVIVRDQGQYDVDRVNRSTSPSHDKFMPGVSGNSDDSFGGANPKPLTKEHVAEGTGLSAANFAGNLAAKWKGRMIPMNGVTTHDGKLHQINIFLAIESVNGNSFEGKYFVKPSKPLGRLNGKISPGGLEFEFQNNESRVFDRDFQLTINSKSVVSSYDDIAFSGLDKVSRILTANTEETDFVILDTPANVVMLKSRYKEFDEFQRDVVWIEEPSRNGRDQLFFFCPWYIKGIGYQATRMTFPVSDLTKESDIEIRGEMRYHARTNYPKGAMTVRFLFDNQLKPAKVVQVPMQNYPIPDNSGNIIGYQPIAIKVPKGTRLLIVDPMPENVKGGDQIYFQINGMHAVVGEK